MPTPTPTTRRTRETFWRTQNDTAEASTPERVGVELDAQTTPSGLASGATESPSSSASAKNGTSSASNGPQKIILRLGGGASASGSGAATSTPAGGAKGGQAAGSRANSRATTPDPVLGKKRKIDTSSATRASPRHRVSPPGTAAPNGAESRDGSPSAFVMTTTTTAAGAPIHASSSGTGTPSNLPASLAIFAPPPPSEALPQALQDVITASTIVISSSGGDDGASTPATASGGPSRRGGAADKDGLLRDAAEGLSLRRRPVRNKEVVVRAGVSASGKGVRVGNAGTRVPQPGRKRREKAMDNVPNQDFCSVCRGIGRFLCCDGCPRSFHFMCLEPPLRVDELPTEEVWYCKKCKSERNKDRSPSPSARGAEHKPIQTAFKMLCKRVDEENPVQFRLPADVRAHFSGVGTGQRGEYQDTEETRTKYDRKGFAEDRDGTRLRDGKARPVSCYMCGGSSVPSRSLTTDPESTWRQIISCDYCALHWHLDCLNPPLASMPPAGRKWMCPNHAEQVMNRRRTLRSGVETIDVEDAETPNNGNIVVMPDEEEDESHRYPPLKFEDMVINRRKYRVPEKIIKLDFWSKIEKSKRGGGGGGGGRDTDDVSNADVDAANLILGLATASTLPFSTAEVPPTAGEPTTTMTDVPDTASTAIDVDGAEPPTTTTEPQSATS